MTARASITPGQRFSRLIILREHPQRAIGGSRQLICRCDCGAERAFRANNLRSGRSRSCGCLQSDTARVTSKKHGLSHRVPEYAIWQRMKQRCVNPRARDYKNYGGRGIVVCPEWSVFEQFYADMGSRPLMTHSIDRIDNDGPYAPWNCRWASREEQGRNTRSTRILTHNGRSMPLSEWAETLGINYYTLHKRLARGWSVDRALTPLDAAWANREPMRLYDPTGS